MTQTRRARALLVPLALCGLSGAGDAATAGDAAAFLRSHCVDCHGPLVQEADLRFDELAAVDADTAALWTRVADALEAGEMPPPEMPSPDAAEKHAALASIRRDLARLAPPAPAVRRMNRVEYEHTVHDLLGVDVPLAPLLPEDGRTQGFDNVAGGLGVSSILLERYLEAADAAFEAAIRRIEPSPPAARRAVLMEDESNISSVKGNKGGVIESHGAFVDFTPGWPPARVDAAHPIEPGVYRCRIAVWPHKPGPDRTLSVAVFTGPLFGPGDRHFQGMFDVTGTPDDPRIVEFTTYMEEGHALHVLPWVSPEHVTWRDKHERRPGVAILWAETYGPLDQAFPSASHRKLFGESDTLRFVEGDAIYMRHRQGAKRHHVDSTAPRADLERIVRDFVPRAFRRPVGEELTDQFVQFALSRLDGGATFEQAARAGVTAVLCSPHFLLLNAPDRPDGAAGEGGEGAGAAGDYTLASRLSYFLWSSMPDDELLDLAAEGRLSDPEILHAQVDRLLAEPKSERFVHNFTGQWLGLRDIEFTTPDGTLYPEYDELLMRSMLAETRGFFRHLLDEDLSVLNFVDSDFAVLNQRLADHYSIPGVRGHEEFRVVQLPEDSVRGGVLAQAAVLKVTANGTATSPVLRGVWALENLLGRPAPPPPAGVPAVEPDIRGAVTIREQLDRHRADPSCNRCHRRIDPPGFALEEFDVIGGHRAVYRSLVGEGPKVPRTNYHEGRPVESDGELSGGRTFGGFVEFRERLLEEPDRVAETLAEKLLVYGCGRPVGPGERASAEAVVDAARKEDFGLRTMIHAVVDSELFRRP